jgi:(R)-2-hydroxyacyl-CoA dehydratese activating ATPase
MFVGVDIGSVTSKAVVIDDRNKIIGFAFSLTKPDRHQSAVDVLDQALKQTDRQVDSVEYIVSTGYGRRAFSDSDKVMPEIVCHAKGTKFLFPEVRTIIDIGGQDSKVIALDLEGNIDKFEMNDKCAAGTGRFLEVLTERILNIELNEAGPLSLRSKTPCIISSVCTIFAESEIISHLSQNMPKEDIIYGMNKAIAKRVISMGRAGQIDYREPIVFSGGVAKNIGVVKAIEEELGKKLCVPTDPQITAALGASLLAKEYATSKK